MKKVVVSILLSAIFLTACGTSGSTQNDATQDDMAGMDHSVMAQEESSTEVENIKVQFKLSSDKTLPNQATTITTTILDKAGKSINEFDTVHEKKMHFNIVSKDLSYFTHIHPDYKGNGIFTVTTQFPTSGEFKMYADITPTGMSAMNKSQWITVQGEAVAQQPIEPESTLTKVVDGKRITLSIDHLMANMELKLNYNMVDSQSNQPITDLQPYLGAIGHVVILTKDAEKYLHVHPTDEKGSGPNAEFMTTFPQSGVYKIWGQFQHKGKVFTVPFVIKVP